MIKIIVNNLNIIKFELSLKLTEMAFKPANKIQDLQYFGEFGGVNPSISDSSTYTFLSAKTMFDTFEGNAEGCYLYARHTSPIQFILRRSPGSDGRN